MKSIVLASSSSTRRALLEGVGIQFEALSPQVDESTVKAAARSDGLSPRDTADLLADLKAQKIANRRPDALVIGSDQTVDLDGRLLSKPADRSAAEKRLRALSGRRHRLHTAVVVYDQARPVWRQISTVELTMRPIGNTYLETYLDRNWPAVSQSAGAYMLEAEGARLFSRIEGDYFATLGLPLVELCSYLTMIGAIEG